MIRRLFVTVIVCALSLPALTFADAPSATDTDITNRVIQQLTQSDRDVARRIHVSTDNGVVKLEGSGLTANQAAKVLVAARSVSGVIKVDNGLHLGL